MMFASAMMLAVTATLIIIMLPKMYGDWLKYAEFRREGAPEQLHCLQASGNVWIARHLGCSLLAIAMIGIIQRRPELTGHAPLAGITAAYAVASMLCAVAESLFAWKVANVAAMARVRKEG
jgi:hypothetical protein